ncbi:hypothetical protein OPV22_005264 [Ensete ventricosum]|uniref:Uncharacterized protein n=1 Tax=Ensete ventricosum TaxID=4639 RepID=A0AAV8RG79_ENSVE|nr:hypothetical protein OPV22_005264 [Ensete ventricosum]
MAAMLILEARTLRPPPFLELRGFACLQQGHAVEDDRQTWSQRSGCPATAMAKMAIFVASEKTMFATIIHRVFLASLVALGILRRSFDMRVMRLVSTATAEPDARMEIPMLAMANAGASFTPSPTILFS